MKFALKLLLLLLLSACGSESNDALGTLEYDRISLPMPVAERINEIKVREGEQIEEGGGDDAGCAPC